MAEGDFKERRAMVSITATILPTRTVVEIKGFSLIPEAEANKGVQKTIEYQKRPQQPHRLPHE